METIDSFELVHAYFMKNYMEGNDLAALEVVNDCYFPPYEALRLGWKMAILAKLKRVDESLDVFQEALDAGYWYDERAARADSDFASLWGNPRFDELIRQSNTAKSAEKTPFVMPVFEPASPSRKLLIALHGNASHAEGIIQYWKPATEWGWIVALPQSNQGMWLSGHYAWDNIVEASILIRQTCKLLTERFRLETIVIAGFSRGGEVALYTGIDLNMDMALLIEPSFPETEDKVPELDSTNKPYTQILSGTMMLEQAKAMAKYLDKQKIPYKLEETENQYHSYPPDFSARIKQALSRFP